MLKHLIILGVSIFTLFPHSACAADQPSRPPNIIFVFADDLGYTDLACFGSRYYETPHLDQLAREGIRCTSAYTCGPNCQPTRAALMSGQYGPRTGVYTVGSIDRFDWQSRPLRPVDNVTDLPLDKMILPQGLKPGGYTTAMFGKWHLGNPGKYHPLSRGFDIGFVSAGAHFDFTTEPKQDVPAGTYLADYLTDRAIEFIHSHKDGPFFLYLPHFGVHSPWDAKPDLTEHFEPKPGVDGHSSPVYAAMISSVDESVGRIRKTLNELHLAENTLLIFTSDNGGVGGYSREGIKPGKEITDNAPLRGGKGMLYEGGIRVPYIACWPGVIAPGSESDLPINSVDHYPTLVEVAGLTPPANYQLDGTSYLPMLKGESKDAGRSPLYWHFPGYLGAAENTWRTTPAGAIRDGDWKLLEFFEDGRRELYNLREDISERHDLATSEPDRAKELHTKLTAWRESINAPMPTRNETIQPSAKRKSRKAKEEE